MAPVRTSTRERHPTAKQRQRQQQQQLLLRGGDGTATAPFRISSSPPGDDDDAPASASFKLKARQIPKASRGSKANVKSKLKFSQSPSPTVFSVASSSSSSLTTATAVAGAGDGDGGGDEGEMGLGEKKGREAKEKESREFVGPVTICGVELRPTVAFDTFWRFAAERKAIDDRRRAGKSPPYTEDKILRDYFFCNTYRVLDKLCQYLIKEVIEKGSQDHEEIVFRVLLFNSYTRIETWELLDRALGPLTWATYDRERYLAVLSAASARGAKLYTGAFIKPAPHFGYQHNYANHLCLVEAFMANQLWARVHAAEYLANVYEYIVAFPSMGAFSAYQLLLCLSYTPVLNFHPGDVVVAGPGSISGLNKMFGKAGMDKGRREVGVEVFDGEVMRWLAATQGSHFGRLGLEFSGLGPRRLPMTVVDVEHTLCEVDKYCRLAHPQLKGKRMNLHRTYRVAGTEEGEGEGKTAMARGMLPKAVLPKAWTHPARNLPKLREDRNLYVEKRYEIEALRGHRDAPEGCEDGDGDGEDEGGRQFLVYWVGYPPSEATWEFESSLVHDAPVVVSEYLRAHGLPEVLDVEGKPCI